MCNRYPNCQHAGPVHDEVEGYPRHCETVLPNHNCSYHARGCKGCTFLTATDGLVITPHYLPPVDWQAEVAKLKHTTVEIKMPIVHMNDDALLALVAGAWKTYAMLQGLVAAGIVTPKWASQSLHNVLQYTYRQAVCRCVAAYILTRS